MGPDSLACNGLGRNGMAQNDRPRIPISAEIIKKDFSNTKKYGNVR
ncbi:hypothetical protein QUB63_24055 [Microcoleus sp. ARI1-B5]